VKRERERAGREVFFRNTRVSLFLPHLLTPPVHAAPAGTQPGDILARSARPAHRGGRDGGLHAQPQQQCARALCFACIGGSQPPTPAARGWPAWSPRPAGWSTCQPCGQFWGGGRSKQPALGILARTRRWRRPAAARPGDGCCRRCLACRLGPPRRRRRPVARGRPPGRIPPGRSLWHGAPGRAGRQAELGGRGRTVRERRKRGGGEEEVERREKNCPPPPCLPPSLIIPIPCPPPLFTRTATSATP